MPEEIYSEAVTSERSDFYFTVLFAEHSTAELQVLRFLSDPNTDGGWVKALTQEIELRKLRRYRQQERPCHA